MSSTLEISGERGRGAGGKAQKGAACARGERIIHAIKEGARARVHENMSDNACHLIHVK